MAFPLQFLLETVLPQLLMGKDKKKHSKKDQASENILDAVALSIKKFRKVTKEISKLSTGQKLVGSLALAAAGLVYMATRDTDETAASSDAKALTDGADAVAAPHRHRKAPKHFSEE
ncbi:hypothetical protein [Hymenobacter negativus]|uniref:YtxH domain-containing protein n=1 Tax=Hymenobacter negativus TaxID=2795026 RepID=A0ABS0Q5S1_9BACT|nr:hypothetical protein [Hymenobacter negativus]MBH8558007.1 hypothetical protein [Hymenobacter negativus]